MTDMAEGLAKLIEEQRQRSFTDPTTADPEDALGILLSQFLGWDGHAILRVAYWALTDANFHTEAEKIVELLEADGGEKPWERKR